MTIALQFALLGLGTGAMYALLAQGTVLIFRGSGVLNLAHAAYAMLGAFLYYQLHQVMSWGLAPAMVVSVLALGVVGALTDQIVLRRLRHTSVLARLIATLGVLIVIQSIGLLKWGADTIIPVSVFGDHPVNVLGATVPESSLWVLGVVVVLTVALTAIWRYSRIGWVTVAVSENQSAAAALGWSPELVSSLTWGVGAALAALAGILIAPIVQLNVTEMSFFIIPALAAALIGGFSSFPLTLLGGLFVGVAQSEVGWYVHLTGASDALPFALIVAVLIVRGSSLPLRGHVFDRLPSVGSGRIRPRLAIPAFIVVAVLVSVLSNDWAGALTVQFSVAIILLSIVVLTGFTGQLSLAQFALAGVGALVAAKLIATQGWPFLPALIAGVLASAVVGLAFAVPALRTRGVNLAVVTLGLGTAIQAMVFDNTSLAGSSAGNDIGNLSLFGLGVGFIDHPQRYALLVFVAFVLAALAVANLRRGRSGLRLLAVRANERAAAATGINVFRVKVHAFTVAGALAGFGGVLLAFQSPSVSVTAFDPLSSISAIAQSVIGGVGYVMGASTGATIAPGALASLVGDQLSTIDKYLPLAGGILLLLTLMFFSDGLEAKNVAGARDLRTGMRGLERRPRRWPAPVGPRQRVRPLTLAVESLTVRYGGVVAVGDVSLEVKPGEVVGLIGPNGAGKTSLLDAISGFAPGGGHVRLGDAVLDRVAPYRRARAGLVRSFQGLELFEDMTARENLQAASDPGDAVAMASDLIRPGQPQLSAAAQAAIEEFGLSPYLDRRTSELSYGQRRLVAIARAVSMEPSVLLLDEPASGLDDVETRELGGLVRRLADEWGMGILVVEHNMDFVMGISDRVVVIDFGMTIAEGSPAQVRASQAAVDAYLGVDPTPEPEPALVAGHRNPATAER